MLQQRCSWTDARIPSCSKVHLLVFIASCTTYVAYIHRSMSILDIKLSTKDHVEKRGSSCICQLVSNFILRYVPRMVNFSYLVV